MTGRVREQGEKVRDFILKNVEAHEQDLVSHVSAKFGISRQAVNKHLNRLRAEGAVEKQGTARSPKYTLAPLTTQLNRYTIDSGLAEDIVWSQHIKQAVGQLPDNVLNIWHHGFTEMFNNAIDHSSGSVIDVQVKKTAVSTEILIADDGVGIFRKIQRELNLLDERHAIFELSKGKLTTDPKNHSGEGIFFTSRMFDKFTIMSGGLMFDHQRSGRMHEDWLMERSETKPGTAVFMELNNHTSRTTKKVFDEFTTKDGNYGFSKTVVPVDLAKYSLDELVSRSQAKRLLARVELFKTVVFDFKGVAAVGQAFADQVFRVFAGEHPDIELLPINMTKDVTDMVQRAISARNAQL
jgi:biotin operon repressor/anti-sigma regulatory factor (Ser/Thr protein kinase)